jgi:hypothetical protein
MNDHADECLCTSCTEPCTAPTPVIKANVEADQEGRGLEPAPHIPAPIVDASSWWC